VAARSVLDGGGMPWHELSVAALSTVVALVAAVAFVRAMMGTFRRRGFVTRYS
jgi:ABC-2 type transport system permease protein